VHYFEPDICLRQLIFAGVRQTFIPPFLLVWQWLFVPLLFSPFVLGDRLKFW
jgi:hypothetical protein